MKLSKCDYYLDSGRLFTYLKMQSYEKGWHLDREKQGSFEVTIS
jgi:hypothetical protein